MKKILMMALSFVGSFVILMGLIAICSSFFGAYDTSLFVKGFVVGFSKENILVNMFIVATGVVLVSWSVREEF